jgi:hypothetical protein
MIRRVAFLVGLLLSAPLGAAPIQGVFALADTQPKVTGTATVAATPLAGMGAEAVVAVSMVPVGGSRPVTEYDLELGKRLHLIAISAGGRGFVHEHGDRPGADGVFRVRLRLPWGDVWRLYADATPAGLGQQVLRFDVDLGAGPGAEPGGPDPSGLQARDGRYSVRFDSLALQAGRDAQLSFHLLRDGKPAPDLAPFLGVAAHAVLVNAADLSYVHVHAQAGSEPMQHDMNGMHMAGHPAAVAPDLGLSIRPPKPGDYWLWLQFMAGGKVRTVRFVVPVS